MSARPVLKGITVVEAASGLAGPMAGCRLSTDAEGTASDPKSHRLSWIRSRYRRGRCLGALRNSRTWTECFRNQRLSGAILERYGAGYRSQPDSNSTRKTGSCDKRANHVYSLVIWT